jgi:predicted metal-dependent peptidase
MTPTLSKIDKAMNTLVLDQPFFAVLAMRLEQVETKEVPTFATDGKRLLINPDFCASLSDGEVVTVLAHEVLHCALGHIWRAPAGADLQTWNLAIDNETNWELEKVNRQNRGVPPFPWPSCGKVMEDRFEGWAAERVYKVLAEEKAQQKEDQQGQQGQGGGKGQQQKAGGQGQNKGKGQQGQGQPGQGQQQGFGDIIPVKKDDQAQLKQEWERAVIQAEKCGRERGDIPGAVKELIQEVTSTKVDWRNILRDFLSTTAKEDWNFARPNARFEDTGFLMPSLYNERAGHLVFAIDTSGSTSSELLAEYIAEAQQALDELNPEKLTLVYCDAKIQHVQEYEPGDKIELETYGRGGTDFRPVFNHFNKADEAPKIVVYLTDLEGTFPKEAPEYPVLWVTENHGQEVPFGDLIEV